MKKAIFIPALKFSWLTRFFDPFLRITMPEREIKSVLIKQLNIKKSDNILDFGCGTATLTIMTKEMHSDAFVYGVDVDSKVLEIAKEKVNKRNLDIHLDIYDGTVLPYKDGTFDKVMTSLVFHHLKRNQKVNALHEIHRVLKHGGELHIVDFGKANNRVMAAVSFIPRLIDGLENTSDNVNGLIPVLMNEAGFMNVIENRKTITIFGSLSYYSAKKPL
jgi:SAM-dependent methyltransferase